MAVNTCSPLHHESPTIHGAQLNKIVQMALKPVLPLMLPGQLSPSTIISGGMSEGLSFNLMHWPSVDILYRNEILLVTIKILPL